MAANFSTETTGADGTAVVGLHPGGIQNLPEEIPPGSQESVPRRLKGPKAAAALRRARSLNSPILRCAYGHEVSVGLYGLRHDKGGYDGCRHRINPEVTRDGGSSLPWETL
jgi:hypothetical protein